VGLGRGFTGFAGSKTHMGFMINYYKRTSMKCNRVVSLNPAFLVCMNIIYMEGYSEAIAWDNTKTIASE
jgi:hypothetical protein